MKNSETRVIPGTRFENTTPRLNNLSCPMPHHHYRFTNIFLQGTIANKNLFVIGIRKKVSFELGKEIEKFVFRLVTSMEQRKNTESP